MLDHQWDGKIIPVENVTVAQHIETGVDYLITKIHRYNRSPAKIYQYACSVRNLITGVSGAADVWYAGIGGLDSILLLEDGISYLLLEDGASALAMDIAIGQIWKCGTYVPVRYRDYDGVVKNM